jgi:hypothetical protein
MKLNMDRKTIFTVSFVLTLLALVVLRTNQMAAASWLNPSWLGARFSPKPAASPEDSIYAMLDAARAGDTKTYLDLFASPMRDQLLQVVKENSETKFADYLKSQNTAFQSVAVSIADRTGDSEVLARVEYVYTDRNEVQNLYLRKETSGWRIFKIAGSDQIKTLVPFGSSVGD